MNYKATTKRIQDSLKSQYKIKEHKDGSIQFGVFDTEGEQHDSITFTKKGEGYISPPKAVMSMGMPGRPASKEALMEILENYAKEKGGQIIKDSVDQFLTKEDLMRLKEGDVIVSVYNDNGEIIEEDHKVISIDGNWLETEGPYDEEDDYSYTDLTETPKDGTVFEGFLEGEFKFKRK